MLYCNNHEELCFPAIKYHLKTSLTGDLVGTVSKLTVVVLFFTQKSITFNETAWEQTQHS